MASDWHFWNCSFIFNKLTRMSCVFVLSAVVLSLVSLSSFSVIFYFYPSSFSGSVDDWKVCPPISVFYSDSTAFFWPYDVYFLWPAFTSCHPSHQAQTTTASVPFITLSTFNLLHPSSQLVTHREQTVPMTFIDTETEECYVEGLLCRQEMLEIFDAEFVCFWGSWMHRIHHIHTPAS